MSTAQDLANSLQSQLTSSHLRESAIPLAKRLMVERPDRLVPLTFLTVTLRWLERRLDLDDLTVDEYRAIVPPVQVWLVGVVRGLDTNDLQTAVDGLALALQGLLLAPS
jgi:hypothetical protein